MAAASKRVKRGFILGKFMPPHAGHVTLIQSARALVDELTILLCSLPDDPIPGEMRLEWMKELFPDCRIRWQSRPVPQDPAASPDFWDIWERVIAKHHPERIDYVFAGEAYGADIAAHTGGMFVPLGARVLDADQRGLGGLSGSAIRAAPWQFLDFPAGPVPSHYGMKGWLHGIESGRKTTLAERVAEHYSTI